MIGIRLWQSILAAVAAAGAIVACSQASGDRAEDEDEDGGSALPWRDAAADAQASETRDAGRDGADSSAPTRICSDDDFCHSVVPKGEHFRGLWGDHAGTLWAFSLEQNILRWDGSSWQVHAHASDPITAIWGSGPSDVWVSTTKGLLHGVGPSPGEIVFSPSSYVPGNPSAAIMALWGTGPDDIWAVGATDGPLGAPRGRVVHYTNDPDLGRGWRLVDALSSLPIRFRGVWGSERSGVWVHGVRVSEEDHDEHACVFRLAPGGAAFTPIELPDDPAPFVRPYARRVDVVGMIASASIWLFGETGVPRPMLWRGVSADDGATFEWSAEVPAEGRPTYALWGLAADDLWAVGRTGLVAHWDGTHFEQAVIRVTSSPVDKSLWAIWGESNDDFWAVGDEIAIHRTRKGEP